MQRRDAADRDLSSHIAFHGRQEDRQGLAVVRVARVEQVGRLLGTALSMGLDRHERVFILTLARMTQVDRAPDWVFRRLHDPETLLGCVPGGSCRSCCMGAE